MSAYFYSVRKSRTIRAQSPDGLVVIHRLAFLMKPIYRFGELHPQQKRSIARAQAAWKGGELEGVLVAMEVGKDGDPVKNGPVRVRRLSYWSGPIWNDESASLPGEPAGALYRDAQGVLRYDENARLDYEGRLVSAA